MLPLALIPVIAQLAPLAAWLIGNAIDGKAGAAVGEEVAKPVTGVAERVFGTSEPRRGGGGDPLRPGQGAGVQDGAPRHPGAARGPLGQPRERQIRPLGAAVRFRAPLVAAACNAGSLRENAGNRWHLQATTEQVERYVIF